MRFAFILLYVWLFLFGFLNLEVQKNFPLFLNTVARAQVDLSSSCYLQMPSMNWELVLEIVVQTTLLFTEEGITVEGFQYNSMELILLCQIPCLKGAIFIEEHSCLVVQGGTTPPAPFLLLLVTLAAQASWRSTTNDNTVLTLTIVMMVMANSIPAANPLSFLSPPPPRTSMMILILLSK